MQSTSAECEENDVDANLQCAACTTLLKGTLHIKCGECDARLCRPCFRLGIEVGVGNTRHLRGHNYEIVDHRKGRMQGGWGQHLESRLIEAADRYKLGNWYEVAKTMDDEFTAQESLEYFDQYFIRGPIGQFALKSVQWMKQRKDFITSGKVQEIVENKSHMFRYHLMKDAIKWKYESEVNDGQSIPDLDDEEDEENTLQEFVQFITGDNFKAVKKGSSEVKRYIINNELLKYDPFDPSDSEDFLHAPKEVNGGEPILKKNKMSSNYLRSPSVRFEEGTEDSDIDIKPKVGIVIRRETTGNGKYKVSSMCDGYSPMNGNKEKPRSMHSPGMLNGNRTPRTTKKAFVSSDDDADEDAMKNSGNELILKQPKEEFFDDMESPEINGGLELEESESEFEQERTPQPSTSRGPIRRRKTFKSKRQRRLESFEKKIAAKNRKREQAEQLDEICSKREISELRTANPTLQMNLVDPEVPEKLKSNADLKMIGYNYYRDEYDHETFNEAETVISLLQLRAPLSNGDVERVNQSISFARLQKYCRVIQTRNARKNAVMEHDKISEYFNFAKRMTVETRSPKEVLESRDPIEKLLSRCQQTLTKGEMREITDNMDRVDELRNRIEKLRALQTQGITSLKGYETDLSPPKRNKKMFSRSSEKKKAQSRWDRIRRQHRIDNGEE